MQETLNEVATLTAAAVQVLTTYGEEVEKAEKKKMAASSVPFPPAFNSIVRQLVPALDSLIPRPAELRRVLTSGEKLAGRLRTAGDWHERPDTGVIGAIQELAMAFSAEPAAPAPRQLPALEPIEQLLAEGVSLKQIGLIYGLTPTELERELAEPGCIVEQPGWSDPRLNEPMIEEKPQPFPVPVNLTALAEQFERDAPQPAPKRSVWQAWPSDPGAAERLAGAERAAVADLALAKLRASERRPVAVR